MSDRQHHGHNTTQCSVLSARTTSCARSAINACRALHTVSCCVRDVVCRSFTFRILNLAPLQPSTSRGHCNTSLRHRSVLGGHCECERGFLSSSVRRFVLAPSSILPSSLVRPFVFPPPPAPVVVGPLVHPSSSVRRFLRCHWSVGLPSLRRRRSVGLSSLCRRVVVVSPSVCFPFVVGVSICLHSRVRLHPLTPPPPVVYTTV